MCKRSTSGNAKEIEPLHKRVRAKSQLVRKGLVERRVSDGSHEGSRIFAHLSEVTSENLVALVPNTIWSIRRPPTWLITFSCRVSFLDLPAKANCKPNDEPLCATEKKQQRPAYAEFNIAERLDAYPPENKPDLK